MAGQRSRSEQVMWPPWRGAQAGSGPWPWQRRFQPLGLLIGRMPRVASAAYCSLLLFMLLLLYIALCFCSRVWSTLASIDCQRQSFAMRGSRMPPWQPFHAHAAGAKHAWLHQTHLATSKARERAESLTVYPRHDVVVSQRN